MSKDYKNNDLQIILTQAIDQMKMELGDKFHPGKINLAELERRTGISRSRLAVIRRTDSLSSRMGVQA